MMLPALFSCYLMCVAIDVHPDSIMPMQAAKPTDNDDVAFLRSAAESTPSMQINAVQAMTGRLLGESSVDRFAFEITKDSSAPTEKAWFELCTHSDAGGIALIRGSSGVELAAGLGHYLRHVANVSFSWPGTGGTSFGGKPGDLPQLVAGSSEAKRFVRSARWLNTWNVCTFSYSFVWWSFERWQQEIDLMALFGVNLPLAYVGQEAVVRSMYKKPRYNLSDDDLRVFFSGPAWLTWQRSQGLRGWGGPLPTSWIDDHEALQRKILTAMRKIGMTPVLPAFGGWVPTAVMKLYPHANISRVGRPPLCAAGTLGDQYGCPAMIDAVDPLFQQLGDDWMQQLNESYGTDDHMFGADGFFSTIHAPWATFGAEQASATIQINHDRAHSFELLKSQPPEWWTAHANGAYQAMARSDPQAVWVYQTYPWHQFIYYHRTADKGDPITLTRALSKAWTSAVPKGKLLLLDLWADAGPLWHLLDSFFGHDFIWCMLHSFGGNDGMWADLQTVSREPILALHNSLPGSLQGYGITPEGINQNWVAYELMLETPWREHPLSPSELAAWIDQYAVRRGHGASNAALKHITSAWQLLAGSVYNLSCTPPGATPHNSTVCEAQREPGLGFHAVNRQPTGRYSLFYQPKMLVSAWSQLLQSVADDNLPSTLLHDLIDVSREALAAVSDILSSDVEQAIANAIADPAEQPALHTALNKMDTLIRDMDALMGTDEAFLLGTWVQNAMSWGHDASEKALYSFNAKYQITGWSFHYRGHLPGTGDYAAKQWNGLLGGYYRQRWALYGQMAISAVAAVETSDEQRYRFPNATAWALAEDNLTDSWAYAATSYPSIPNGDPVALSQRAYHKYSLLLLRSSPIPPAPPTPAGNFTPSGYKLHEGGYWKNGGMSHGTGHDIATCAAECTAAKAGCVAFEVSATEACYMFATMAGGFIKNSGCKTFTKIERLPQ